MMLNLRVCFLNARSLLSHFAELKDCLIQGNYDIVGISETWLKPDILNTMIDIQGYNIARGDRTTRGGGLVLYVKNNFEFSNLIFTQSEICEELWIQLRYFNRIFVVGVIYRPPKGRVGDFLQVFEKRLADFQPYDIICGGDINLNLLSLSDQNVSNFYDFIESLNLQQVIREPTRVTKTSEALLDVILIPTEETNFEAGNIDVGISDHFLTYCNVINKKNKKANYFQSRNIKNINKELLSEFLQATPFQNIIYLQTVDEKVAALNNFLINIFDVLAPVVQFKLKKQKPPWLTFVIQKMIRLKDKAYKKYQKNKTHANWEYYRQIKNQTCIAIRQEKKQFLGQTVNLGLKNKRIFWQRLKNLNVYCGDKCNEMPIHLNVPNDINNHFLQVSSQNSPADMDLLDYYKHNKKVQIPFTFNFCTVSTDVVRKYLFEIKSLATGADQINLDMLLLCVDAIVPYITNIVNSCILDKRFPDIWKVSKIHPLLKKQNINDYNDLRPISILPVLSKIMEKVMNAQIREYLDTHNILPEYQSGFRSGFSCTTALLKITDDIVEATDQGKATALVLIDYSKAFDRINHELLYAILSYVGFDCDAISLIKDYLTDRKQFVETSRGVSSVGFQTCGVPQGSILGPILFSIYTCNLTTCLQYCMVHLYADDTQLYLSFFPHEKNSAAEKINNDLDRLIRFSKKHNLHINASKSNYLIFGKKREELRQSIVLKASSEQLPYSDCSRNLGLYIDTGLKFKHHINKCIQSAYGNLKRLFPHRHLLSMTQKINLCNALVLSHFDFADVVYGPCLDKIDKDRIQRVQKSCLRLIYGIRRRDPVSYRLTDARWLSMEVRRRFHSANLFQSIIRFNRPSYLTNKIRYRTDVHSLNLRHRGLISPPPHTTAFYERSFSYNIYLVFNQIPDDFKHLSMGGFKYHYKKYLLQQI